ELFAFGLTNSISSCFHAFPSAASLSRSAVQVAAGGKTEVTTVFSSILLLFVLFFIGPLFYSVPNCCLSAIIVVALKGMFIHALELKTLWKYSFWDFGTWIFTCVCTVLLDVTFGLLAGVAFSILTIILRTQCPKIRTLGRADDTEFYRDVRRNDLAKESDTIKVVRYEGSIYYASAENFRQSVFQKSGMDPAKIFAKLQKVRAKLDRLAKHDGAEQTKLSPAVIDRIASTEPRKLEEDKFSIPIEPPSPEPSQGSYQKLSNKLCALQNRCTLQHLILDCSCWNFIDFVGAEELQQLVSDYQKLGVTVSLCGMSDTLISLLLRNEKLTVEVPLYPSIHDAMLKCQSQLVDKSEHQRNLQKDFVRNLSNVMVSTPDCDAQTDSLNEDEPGPNFQSGICR
ncbi:STAS domain protein, partial [Opisthorchis viverrini]